MNLSLNFICPVTQGQGLGKNSQGIAVPIQVEFFGAKTKSLDSLEEERQKAGTRKIGKHKRGGGSKRKRQKLEEAAALEASAKDEEGKTVFDFLNKLGKQEPPKGSPTGGSALNSRSPSGSPGPKSLNVQLVEIQRDLGQIKKEYTSLQQTWNVCLAKDSLVAKECQKRMEELKAKAGEISQKEKLIKQKLSVQKDQKGLMKF